MYPATLWLTKASILVFYYELFPFNQKRLRMGLYATTIFTGVCYLVVLYLDAFFCIPISSNWYPLPKSRSLIFCRSLDTTSQCITGISPMIFIVFAVSNILCDLLSTSPPLIFLGPNVNSLHSPLLFITTTPALNTPSNLGSLFHLQSRRDNSLHFHCTDSRNRVHGRYNTCRGVECP